MKIITAMNKNKLITNNSPTKRWKTKTKITNKFLRKFWTLRASQFQRETLESRHLMSLPPKVCPLLILGYPRSSNLVYMKKVMKILLQFKKRVFLWRFKTKTLSQEPRMVLERLLLTLFQWFKELIQLSILFKG